MSSSARPLLMIPGPTEYSAAVLAKLGEPASVHSTQHTCTAHGCHAQPAAPHCHGARLTLALRRTVLCFGVSRPGHISSMFLAEFSSCLKLLRSVHLSETAQPFILSGSGTLGWDLIAVNLCERDHKALVVNTGYFSDSFVDCLDTYGVKAQQVKCEQIGQSVSEQRLREALQANPGLQLVVLTQVDTSTAVLNDIKGMAAVVREAQPDAFIAVDGVCSFGGEDFRFDEWGIDAAMSCSQKALGAPPGLSTLLLSPRALQYVQSGRKTPIASYFGSLLRWLPIMKAYEAEQASYFATPNTSLVRALEVSLRGIVEYGVGKRVADHVAHSNAFKAAMSAIGLTQLAEPARRANTLSAVYYPDTLDTSKFLGTVLASGVICAGGLHKDVKTKYFRSANSTPSTPHTAHTATLSDTHCALQSVNAQPSELTWRCTRVCVCVWLLAAVWVTWACLSTGIAMT